MVQLCLSRCACAALDEGGAELGQDVGCVPLEPNRTPCVTLEQTRTSELRVHREADVA